MTEKAKSQGDDPEGPSQDAVKRLQDAAQAEADRLGWPDNGGRERG